MKVVGDDGVVGCGMFCIMSSSPCRPGLPPHGPLALVSREYLLPPLVMALVEGRSLQIRTVTPLALPSCLVLPRPHPRPHPLLPPLPLSPSQLLPLP